MTIPKTIQCDECRNTIDGSVFLEMGISGDPIRRSVMLIRDNCILNTFRDVHLCSLRCAWAFLCLSEDIPAQIAEQDAARRAEKGKP